MLISVQSYLDQQENVIEHCQNNARPPSCKLSEWQETISLSKHVYSIFYVKLLQQLTHLSKSFLYRSDIESSTFAFNFCIEFCKNQKEVFWPQSNLTETENREW
jgi:hypothetical protein